MADNCGKVIKTKHATSSIPQTRIYRFDKKGKVVSQNSVMKLKSFEHWHTRSEHWQAVKRINVFSLFAYRVSLLTRKKF